jgi:hypothetical protein
MSNATAVPGPNAYFRTLLFPGVCEGCGTKLAPDRRAWYDPDNRRVTCKKCWPATPLSRTSSPRPVPGLPVGGSSALRRSLRTGDRNWRKGAIGEYRMDTCLHRELTSGEVILNDRRIPGGAGNIDHVVVAPSGVWIIDAKNWKGKINYKNVGGILDDTKRLLIDGRDHTALTEVIYQQVIPVAQLLEDRSVPVHPVIVFMNATWSDRTDLRILTGRPYQHQGVWIAWPKALVSKIRSRGPLTTETVERIGRQLDEALRPM